MYAYVSTSSDTYWLLQLERAWECEWANAVLMLILTSKNLVKFTNIFYTGIRKVEVENASTVAGAAVGCAIVTGVVVALVAVIIFTYWRKKVNTM